MSTVAPAQGPVEARSLSSITAIASNPPAYPRNPTHEKLDPLELYIVRVPGSQDIFLSPLKPPTKSSVSAEAINASLYYVHVSTPDDDALLQEVEQEREEEAQRKREALEAAAEDDPSQREFVKMNNVRRKPVGSKTAASDQPAVSTQENATVQENAAPPLPRRPVPMPQVSAENMSFAGTPVAIAQAGFGAESETPSANPILKPSVPRRPLPPLPPREEPYGARPAAEEPVRKTNRWSNFADGLHGKGFEALRGKYDALSAGRHSFDSNRPSLPPRSSYERPGSAHSSGQSPNRQRRHRQAPMRNAGFNITLIRRDPSSGTQWNVATISSSPADFNAIDIEISTPGYNRFTGSNEPLSLASLGANLPAELIKAAGASLSQPVPKVQPAEQPAGPRKFHRQVCVSKPFDETVGSGQGSSDFGNGHGPDASSKLKSGYYVFNSPWNGTCTFSSSVNGRSLKCKHMISGPSSLPVHGEGEANPAVTVAELRFNTPFQAANLRYHAAHQQPQHPSSHSSSHPQFPQDSMSQDPMSASKRASISQFLNPNNYSRPRAHSGPNSSSPTEFQRPNFNPSAIIRKTSLRAGRFTRQNQFAHHPRRSTSTSSGGADSDEDRLDLSLARELAGGGMRGKSAKLGKLIIEDEGFKMLDLVVAACMAVWWRGYYH
ncbi:hypothetical protein N7532_011878 [Penicillium argentinense]|uniref:Uncharacterized protein n=1 Tax=Penicillium argentinense TaxID=1131581 RepID=A0A9W9EJE8_9EURO|nr:uncharacterized protein N7532_011878 [Penicillium argentinense]KAJ5082835.1 hypothetical protein N7532_011878 [Penicillium argentinense]